jgi:hypothetical protein
MTSRGQLQGNPVGLSSLYSKSTEQLRNSLDPQHPLLENFVQFARAIASVLKGYFKFFDEDSEPANLADIRDHMIQEMNLLWNIRKDLISDLGQFFTDANIIMILSQAGKGEEVVDTCIDDRNSIHTAVARTLGKDIRAALDDMSNEQVSSAQRQDSREAALLTLQNVAEKWTTLADELSSAGNIGKEPGSA